MKRICVFCGSSAGARPSYAASARILGSELARRGIGLVFGGGRVGLMGIIADAVLAGGGEAIGVIPGGLKAREVEHRGLTELHVVRSMHERKAMMAALSDGFIAMPGGFGTLEELAEIITWSQLGLHRKPVGILNVEGFYDPLLAFFDRAVDEQFTRLEYRGLVTEATESVALLDALELAQLPVVPAWITGNET